MLTFTQLYKRTAELVGINANQNSVAVLNIKQDINQALRLLKNSSRRYWTRKEVTTDLKANQASYTFPEDMVRITTVRVTSGSLTIPVTLIDSEEMWNRINLVPAMTVGIPTMGFIRGRNELCLYPVPSTDYADGLIVSYEVRLRDMSLDDTTLQLNVKEGSDVIEAASGTPFTSKMIGMWVTVTDGSDGNWYQITGFTDGSHMTLENYYQGPDTNNVAALIGSVPDIPEDYHLALAYYAAYNYYLKRKEMDTAAGYKALFDDLRRQYVSVYAAKTTGYTQDDLDSYQYNLFGLPPQNVSA